MDGRVPARLTRAQGRKFGLTVGIAFLVIATVIAYWHGFGLLPRVFTGVGSLLAISGLLIPTLLGPVERAWMRLAHLISRVTTPIFMGVVYFLVITPVALIRRSLGKNALLRTSHTPHLVAGSYWIERPAGKRRSNLSRQF